MQTNLFLARNRKEVMFKKKQKQPMYPGPGTKSIFFSQTFSLVFSLPHLNALLSAAQRKHLLNCYLSGCFCDFWGVARKLNVIPTFAYVFCISSWRVLSSFHPHCTPIPLVYLSILRTNVIVSETTSLPWVSLFHPSFTLLSWDF